MTILVQVAVTIGIVLFLFGLFALSIHSASREGKRFGCSSLGDGEGACPTCPGRGLRCTVKRGIAKRTTGEGTA